MQYTLKSARKHLRESSNVYGQNDLRESINRAIQNLATMSGWDRLRKVLRFHAVGPHFVLPQGCAGIVRACVNGRPSTVRAQDFRFIQSGPGELNRPPSGFCPVRTSNIVDVGMKPVMFEPRGPFRLFALAPMAESDAGEARIVVRGMTPEGELLQERITPVAPPESADGIYSVQMAPTTFQVVTEVSLVDAVEYITLYAESADTGARFPVGLYNPGIEAPEFRHYELAGVPPGAPLELLVECRIDPVPLVDDADVLPLPSLNPVEWMIRGNWLMRSGETEAAQKYYSMAASWLKAIEVTEATVQTPVVVNSRFLGSPGEVSMDAVNI